MQGITRGTTPALQLKLDTSITGCAYYVTLRCGSYTLTKDNDDCSLSLDGKSIAVPLTQQETLNLTAGYIVSVQVKYKDGAGMVHATNIATTTALAILNEAVV